MYVRTVPFTVISFNREDFDGSKLLRPKWSETAVHYNITTSVLITDSWVKSAWIMPSYQFGIKELWVLRNMVTMRRKTGRNLICCVVEMSHYLMANPNTQRASFPDSKSFERFIIHYCFLVTNCWHRATNMSMLILTTCHKGNHQYQSKWTTIHNQTFCLGKPLTCHTMCFF